VDVTECAVSKPKDWPVQRFLFSKKKETTTLKYEVVTQIATGYILRISGGIPKRHDRKMQEDFGLLKILEPWEKGIADKGYQGANENLMTPFKRRKGQQFPEYCKIWNRCIASVRATAERTNALIKVFGALSKVWRGELERIQ
jgi:hypothetical protein